ncbi:hypothetical protein [Herminiimonas sp. CN]|uniref:hypothetical protein n=1 Tax=Herminiimonas sp. CN TaxID=1349818 RepID=UPI000474134A|nr:hypothetical protein [Herminiimonas sp. CN]
MATINAPTLQNVQYSGDDGSAFAHGQITLAAAQIADKVRLVKLFAGTKIYCAKMINAALGASSTISLGFEYVNAEAGGGAAALIPATSTAAIAKTDSIVAPVTLDYDAYITATVAGAAATGQFDAVISFEHRGTL